MATDYTLSPSQREAPITEIGHDTGLPLSSGFGATSPTYGVAEPEYVEALRWPASVGVYDRMANDSKITSIFKAVTLPIRAANRALDGTGCRPEVTAQLAADIGVPILGQDAAVNAPLRSRDRFLLSDHLRLALLALRYGFMAFEQVVRVDTTGPTPLVRLRKLAPRFPATISQIQTAPDGGLVGIKQYAVGSAAWVTSFGPTDTRPPIQSADPQDPIIDVSRLVMYSFDREGAAWQGRSMLRHAYGPWLQKDRALRNWSTTLERNGMGTPIYAGAEGESQAQLNAGSLLAQRVRTGEAAGAGVPHGASMTFQGVQGTLPSFLEHVGYLDEKIAEGALAEFQKLGSGHSGSGSRSLGKSFIDFFKLSMQTVDDFFNDTFNEHVIEDLVDWNWGPDEPAPRLVTTEKIGDDDDTLAASISVMAEYGLLTYDPALESWIRARFGLPQRDPSDVAPLKPVPSLTHDQVTVAAANHPHWPQRVAAAGAGREPTDAEVASGLDVKGMDTAWQAALATLLTTWAGVRDDQLDAILAAIRAAINAGDLAALGRLPVPAGLGTAALTEAMTNLAHLAAAAAAAEAATQGLDVTPADPAVVNPRVAARAGAVDGLLAATLTAAAARQAILNAGPSTDADEVAKAVEDHVTGLSDAYLHDQLGGALTAAQNTGRVETFRPLDAQVTYYASELLDSATCQPCAAEDGHQFTSLTDAEAAYPTGGYADCLGGPRCRGTLVAVRNEATPTT